MAVERSAMQDNNQFVFSSEEEDSEEEAYLQSLRDKGKTPEESKE